MCEKLEEEMANVSPLLFNKMFFPVILLRLAARKLKTILFVFQREKAEMGS